jgi:hypothetical protein
LPCSHIETAAGFGKSLKRQDYLILILAEKQAYAGPMNSLNPQTSRPTEDLDAVIGRFQAWTMTQTQTKPTAKDAVSEISYEQALRATARYRRPEALDESLPQTPSWTPATDSALPELGEQPKTHTAASARKRQQGKVARKAVSEKRAVVATDTSLTNPPGKKIKQSRESFAQVLRQEAGLARVEANTLRSSALTVRLAPEESALIKARADEAQLSTSAYLRQCALEVESLRAQVRETLAKMRTPVVSAIPAQAPALPAVTTPSRPGLFGGIRRWLIRRLGGQQVDAVC